MFVHVRSAVDEHSLTRAERMNDISTPEIVIEYGPGSRMFTQVIHSAHRETVPYDLVQLLTAREEFYNTQRDQQNKDEIQEVTVPVSIISGHPSSKQPRCPGGKNNGKEENKSSVNRRCVDGKKQ